MVARRSVALATAVIGVYASSAFALDGATTPQITPASIPGTDWRILELYTGGNTITSIADPGYTQ